MNKKGIALLCALALAVGMACPASAETGPLQTVYDAGMALMFAVPNVTLETKVTVARNGMVFKTVSGSCIHAEDGDEITLFFKTMRPDLTSYETSWHVTGKDGSVWSVDLPKNDYYNQLTYEPTASVLSVYGNPLYQALKLVSPAMELADLLYPAAAERTRTADGETILVRFEDGEAPRLFDALAEKLIRYAAQEYMGIYLPESAEETETAPYEPDGPELVSDDWDLLLNTAWKALYGDEPAPEDFYGELPEEEAARLEAVWDYIDSVAAAAAEAENRTDGYLLIHGADASVTWFENYGECLVASGGQYIIYQDEMPVFLSWLKAHTGDEWDENTLRAAWTSNNEDLWNALDTLEAEMEMEYISRLENNPAGFVDADGVLTPIPDLDLFYAQQQDSDSSIAYTVLSGMNSVRVGKASVTFALDTEGRLTGADGKIDLHFLRRDGSEDLITLDLSCTAGGYGTSTVAPFDPEEWGVISYRDWLNGLKDPEPASDPLPVIEKVVLNGTEYLLNP